MMSLRNDVVSQLGVEAYMYIYMHTYIHINTYNIHTYLMEVVGLKEDWGSYDR